ncbi:MAG: phage shock protein operon transcriptional activator [Desulfobacterales bacterium]|jgi:psp operon transcriptional activator
MMSYESNDQYAQRHYGRETPPTADQALGQSETFLEFQERLSRVAPVNRPTLLLGERGSGKELAANRLHYLSKRWQGSFLTLNCSALSPSLIESELFGFEKGAFTGAAQRRIGRFEAADGGSLFLDEIGNIPMEVQEKILRVVEYNSFERVGSSESIDVDVRIIAATNADVKDLAAKNLFKQDLLDRLSFEVLIVPPMRERKDDILLLVNHFAGRMAVELGWTEIPQFSKDAVRALEDYPWPGNVRELKNVVERAVYRSDSPRITEIVFDPFISPYMTKTPEIESERRVTVDASPDLSDLMTKPLQDAVWDLKVRMLDNALVQAKFNQKKAARLLGLTYHQFRGLYRKYQDEGRRATNQ